MYSIVLRHLSGIQKGIQHGHSKDAFEMQYSKTPEYQQWLKEDKTVVVLETHSTDSMREIISTLMLEKINFAFFAEPDLGNNYTSISLLVEEEVWDFDTYPNEPFEFFAPGATPVQLREGRRAAQLAANQIKYGKRIAFLKQFTRDYNLASN
jgi:hypothetical protein